SPYTVSVGNTPFKVKYEHFWKTVHKGVWEPLTFRIFDSFLDADHSFIDIGAWVGPTALYGSTRAQHCYAIEPDPVAFKTLRQNVSLNPRLTHKITCSQVGIGAATGTMTLG